MKLNFSFSSIAGSLASLLLLVPGASQAEVLLSEAAALARAFPGEAPVRRTLYLKPEELDAVQKAARSKLPSPIVTLFEARRDGALTGRGVLDTHVVRTMPETVLTVIEPDGRLRLALVLQFGEPSDYLPRERWLETLRGRALDDELAPGRGVRRVTGSTLTVQALTESVRRSLAIDAWLRKGKAP
jgi:hypothetical protein